MRSRRLPRPPPPGTAAVWRHDVPGLGELYTNGMVMRDGVPTYLLRVSIPERNESAVCVMSADGTVTRWFFSWARKEEELRDVLDRARQFVLADQVISS